MPTIGNTQSRLWARRYARNSRTNPRLSMGSKLTRHTASASRTLNRAEARDKGAMYISNLEESTWRAPGYK